MQENLQDVILKYLGDKRYRPIKSRSLAKKMKLADEENYASFRRALKQLRASKRVVLTRHHQLALPAPASQKKDESATTKTSTNSGNISIAGTDAGSNNGAHPIAHMAIHPAEQHPTGSGESSLPKGIVIGTYRQNRRGFGFVIPTQPAGHEDLFISESDNATAITGDTVRAKVTFSHRRGGQKKYEGRILEILTRARSRFVGSLAKQHGAWVVLPDGNDLTTPISVPDAGSRYLKPGTKVVVDLTTYPNNGQGASGVISEVLGERGAKDVDLRGVIVQYNLPQAFEEAALDQARAAMNRFNQSIEQERAKRLDLTDELICTIDPDDAKDYDDAISVKKLANGHWELGVHIADVSYFVEPGSPLDVEARERGNSAYFPGYVIPMLPEILSNGVCSLQEGVPRLCKSVLVELDGEARPLAARFADSVISSKKRLRYREAQAILDGAKKIPHPDGDRSIGDYPPQVVELLHNMNELASVIQKRRIKAGQLVLSLPGIDLVLDEEGKVVDAVPEDESFTHTIIEMFMVEANEAVARQLNRLDIPFIRRIHELPPPESLDRLAAFSLVSGHKLPKTIDRFVMQKLLDSVKDKPESFAVNLAVLKSLARAEYSPRPVGHFALASEQYAHFTSPIRRYADLTVHRLLQAYLAAQGDGSQHGGAVGSADKSKIHVSELPDFQELTDLGKHLSYTERRADDAEKELRAIKVLELLQSRVGENFKGVVTSVTKFGIFIQLQAYLIDGLVRYEDLLDQQWDVDDRIGVAQSRGTGQRIVVGDQVEVTIARVDVPRRELDLAISKLYRGAPAAAQKGHKKSAAPPRGRAGGKLHTSGKPKMRTRNKAAGHRKGPNSANKKAR